MGFRRVVKKGLSGGLNPKRWLGYDQLKEDTASVGNIARSVFKREKNTERKETFDDAVKRFNLTEEDIKKRMKTSKQLVALFLGMGGLLFAYFVYQCATGHILHSFICLVLTALILVNAFREHFNLFQMRQRRLGCTYKEWVNSLFKRSK